MGRWRLNNHNKKDDSWEPFLPAVVSSPVIAPKGGHSIANGSSIAWKFKKALTPACPNCRYTLIVAKGALQNLCIYIIARLPCALPQMDQQTALSGSSIFFLHLPPSVARGHCVHIKHTQIFHKVHWISRIKRSQLSIATWNGGLHRVPWTEKWIEPLIWIEHGTWKSPLWKRKFTFQTPSWVSCLFPCVYILRFASQMIDLLNALVLRRVHLHSCVFVCHVISC